MSANGMRASGEDSSVKKMIHGFFGLSETVTVQHKGVEFRVRFSRDSTDPEAAIRAVVEGSDRVTSAVRSDDPVWTVVAHGSNFMFFRTSYSRRLARAEIILSADRTWRFSWETHTDRGVPERRRKIVR
jgi:hypothetical protein